MQFNKTRVNGFETAIRGMRNPHNSWNKNDSFFGLITYGASNIEYEMSCKWISTKYPDVTIDSKEYNEIRQAYDDWLYRNGILQIDPYTDNALVAFIGPQDMKLATDLIKAGAEHRKFLRQINANVDITAPIYWWKELDTYKIGTTANSTSTMHTLTDKEITLDCFEIDDYNPDLVTDISTIDNEPLWKVSDETKEIIDYLNKLREKYIETKDKRYWKELIRWLPESWLQTRTWTANYEVLYNIYHQRQNHKLIEWNHFLNWIETLPYAYSFIEIDNSKNL